LVRHFIDKNNVEMGKNCTGVAEDAMQMLMNYEWKGNIRELQNVIERAIIFAESEQLQPVDIGLMGPTRIIGESAQDLHAAMKACEREHIIRILNKHEGNKVEAAKTLGVGLSSLYRKIYDLKIDTGKGIDEPRSG
jgi:transcriptional regulator with PAS, ATPase and Fis domain